MTTDTPMVRLVFNNSSVHNLFRPGGDGLRFKIENSMLYFKSAPYVRGNNTLTMERTGKGYIVDIMPDTGNALRIITILRELGFRPQHPYFRLTEFDHKWIGIEHWREDAKPHLTVNFFEMVEFSEAITAHSRFLQVSGGIDAIQFNLNKLSEDEWNTVKRRASKMAHEVLKVIDEPAPIPRPPVKTESTRVTRDDVIRALRDTPRPETSRPLERAPRRPRASPEIVAQNVLSDEEAMRIIYGTSRRE